MNKQLKKIVVDLTPILPGGENGGAKVFVLELLNRLAEMHHETEYVLLTQAASHQELAIMDRPNMRRVMVLGEFVADSPIRKLVSSIQNYLPGRARRVFISMRYRISSFFKKNASSSLLHDLDADLLFCPFTAPTYFEPGIPTVCTIYDLQYKTYPGFFSEIDNVNRERTFVEACRKATVLTAISDYSRDSAILHGNLDAERIRTIYLRMAHRVSHDTLKLDILERLNLVKQRYLIYPANFWKHKNHEMLLTAFGIACQNLPDDIKLVCTGAPGDRFNWLIKATEQMGLKNRVIFPGYVSNDELGQLLVNSKGMIFPSLYEGFGLPVIEAMAAGVPVACSNCTSLPEIAANAALMFDPRIPAQIADAIDNLVSDELLRANYIDAGLQRAKEFSDSNQMASEYWDLFQYAVNNHQNSNHLVGVFDDGWIGANLSVAASKSDGERSLEIEVFAPDWLPLPKFKIQATDNKNNTSLLFDLARGATEKFSLPLNDGVTKYDIKFSPTFIPKNSGHGDDQRELSVLMRQCSIKDANNQYTQLFPNPEG